MVKFCWLDAFDAVWMNLYCFRVNVGMYRLLVSGVPNNDS